MGELSPLTQEIQYILPANPGLFVPEAGPGLFRERGAAQRSAFQLAGVLAVIDGGLAVDEDPAHAFGHLVRLLIGSRVHEGFGVEDDDVGKRALLDPAAVGEAE